MKAAKFLKVKRLISAAMVIRDPTVRSQMLEIIFALLRDEVWDVQNLNENNIGDAARSKC